MVCTNVDALHALRLENRRVKMSEQPYNYCHFQKMEYAASDCDDIGHFEEWLECRVCGHTKPVDPPALQESENG